MCTCRWIELFKPKDYKYFIRILPHINGLCCCICIHARPSHKISVMSVIISTECLELFYGKRASLKILRSDILQCQSLLSHRRAIQRGSQAKEAIGKYNLLRMVLHRTPRLFLSYHFELDVHTFPILHHDISSIVAKSLHLSTGDCDHGVGCNEIQPMCHLESLDKVG